MTDEYRMFLESRRSEESDHQELEHSDIPKWTPPSKQEPVSTEDTDHIKHSEFPKWTPPSKKEVADVEEDHVEHDGIKGMKWHHRRFQYKNGTLTPEGRLRYLKNGGKDGDSSKEKSEDKPVKKEKFNSNTLKYKKSAQSLTDEELDARNRRMQKETQYNMLRKQLQPKTKAERRKEIRNQILVATLTTAAAAIMTQVYKKAAIWMVKKATGGKINLGGK